MIDEVKEVFCSLSAQDQARFLARLLHESTMWARSRYPEIRPDDPAKIVNKLKGFNEFSHVVSSQLRAILEGNEARYPDDVFFNILVEQSCMTDFALEVGCQFKDLYEDQSARKLGQEKEAKKRGQIELLPTTSGVKLG